MINIEHFFIGNKDLRNFGHVFIDIFLNQPALVNKYAVYHRLLLSHRFGSLHLAVMHAAHSQRIEYLLTCDLFHTVFPKFINGGTVVYIIVCPLSSPFPLTGGITGHRFAVGSSYKYSVFLRCFPIAFGQKERKRTFVHSRPIGVGTQAKQQFKDTFVCTRPDFTFYIRKFVSPAAPWHQSPIFVIDKNTAIFY